MALAADTLDELVTADLKSEWLIAKGQWFPRSDTPENAAYDKRTPGKYNTDICDHYAFHGLYFRHIIIFITSRFTFSSWLDPVFEQKIKH